MNITLTFEDGTVVSFNEGDTTDDYFREGTWTYPYPNTQEDSIVFGLIEAWSQEDRWIRDLLFEKGEPKVVTISR